VLWPLVELVDLLVMCTLRASRIVIAFVQLMLMPRFRIIHTVGKVEFKWRICYGSDESLVPDSRLKRVLVVYT